MPSKEPSKAEIIRYFCKHLVALFVTFQTDADIDQGLPPQFTAYSGTLLRIQDLYFYVTAGHNLRQLTEAIESDRVEVQALALADVFGEKPSAGNIPIPFAFDKSTTLFIDEDGLDFGLIYLRP